MQYDIVKITDHPSLKQQAAEWFSEKWHIPIEAYLKSMDEAIHGEKAVPQWYLALENGRSSAEWELSKMTFTRGKTLRRYERKGDRYALSSDRPHIVL